MMKLIVILIATFWTAGAGEDKTVMQYMVENGYTTMTSLLRTAGLDAELSAIGTFTVFAVTDDAFHKLGSSVLTNLTNNHAKLTRVMEYHVVKELILLASFHEYRSAETMLKGQYVTIHKLSATEAVLNKVTRILPSHDVMCINGIIQPIDGLLYATDISHILLEGERFRDFSLELLFTGLLRLLAGESTLGFTVFAPRNDAYSDPNARNPNNEELVELLKNYIIPGRWRIESIKSGMLSLYSINGRYIDVTTNSQGTFTVFAPADDVFHKLGPGMQSSLNGDPVELRRVMEYHVVKQFILIPLITGHFSAETMLSGQYIHLHKISDKEALINNGTRILSPNGIVCNNGVIQPIDGLLVPHVAAHAALDLAQILVRDEDTFRDFALEMLTTGLLSLLHTGDYTVLVPTNDAFAQSRLAGPDRPTHTPAVYLDIMKSYIIPGARDMASLRSGHAMYALNGRSINVTVTGADVMIDKAHVINEILASNGVIYVLDHLIGGHHHHSTHV